VAGHDSRIGDRQTASMRIKLKYPDVETFIQKYAVNISRGGIFIATKQPKPVGTFVRFEFLLSDAPTTSIIRGEGQVQWTKEFDPALPNKAHGMGVKFTRLDAESQGVIDRALRWRAEHGTNPRVPVPVPTSSAHTITSEASSKAAPLPKPAPEPEPRDEPTDERPTPGALTDAPIEGRGETRPIAIEHRDEPLGRAPHEHTRPIPVRPRALGRSRAAEEIDALVNELGMSDEKLARILKRARPPRMAEATAELERLLLKPPKLPTPTKAEARELLKELLAKKNGRNGTSNH
jgi:molecular chaperone DnaK